MICPLRGKLVVEIIPDAKMTESGLYLADTVKEVPHRGKVLAMGLPWMDSKGVEHPWHFNCDEVVHFKRNWTNKDEKNFILRYDEIFAYENDGYPEAVQDYVIVRRVYTKKIGASSIIIPETYGVKQNYEEFYGEVMSVGPDDKLGIEEKDKILYQRNEGSSVKIGKEEFFSLKPRAIMAKI